MLSTLVWITKSPLLAKFFLYIHHDPLEKLKTNTDDKSETYLQNFSLILNRYNKKTLQNKGFKYRFMLIAGIEPATSSLPWMRSAYWAKSALPNNHTIERIYRQEILSNLYQNYPRGNKEF